MEPRSTHLKARRKQPPRSSSDLDHAAAAALLISPRPLEVHRHYGCIRSVSLFHMRLLDIKVCLAVHLMLCSCKSTMASDAVMCVTNIFTGDVDESRTSALWAGEQFISSPKRTTPYSLAPSISSDNHARPL